MLTEARTYHARTDGQPESITPSSHVGGGGIDCINGEFNSINFKIWYVDVVQGGLCACVRL